MIAFLSNSIDDASAINADPIGEIACGMGINMEEKERKKERRRIFRKTLFSKMPVRVGAAMILLFFFVALLAGVISPYDPYAISPAEIWNYPSARHILGTDGTGRDVFSRILYGTRTSLIVGLGSVICSAAIGIALGLISGYIGGITDSIISRFLDVFMTVPMILLALCLGMVFGAGTQNVVIVLGLSFAPVYARMMRGQVISIKNMDYILAEQVLGAKKSRIMWKHVLPNCVSPLIVMMTKNIGDAIIGEASLSFLGMGISSPTATWGGMISESYTKISSNPAFALVPGLCIVLMVLSFNLFGDGLRDAMDPRMRGKL